jgi:uncharacterized cupredoxin-like copper-binding protein
MMIKKKITRQMILLVLTAFFLLTYWVQDSYSFNEKDRPINTPSNHIEVQLNEWTINTNTIALAKGEKVSLTIVNKGSYAHDFVIPELNVKTKTLSPNQEETLTFVADQTMTLRTYCSLPGHKESGMEAKLYVK